MYMSTVGIDILSRHKTSTIKITKNMEWKKNSLGERLIIWSFSITKNNNCKSKLKFSNVNHGKA